MNEWQMGAAKQKPPQLVGQKTLTLKTPASSQEPCDTRRRPARQKHFQFAHQFQRRLQQCQNPLLQLVLTYCTKLKLHRHK